MGALKTGVYGHGILSKSVAGSANVDLTQTETENGILLFTGALTGNIEVHPVQSRSGYVWSIFNNTTGAFTLTFKPSGATGIVIPRGVCTRVYFDGTNVVRLDPDPTRVFYYIVEDLAAGADIAGRRIGAAPALGMEFSKIGIVPQATIAGVDAGNTLVIAVKDEAGNTIVTKTYNNVTTPPAAGVYDNLGTLDATHKELTANEVFKIDVTQGATADSAGIILVFEWASPAF